jgi:hypothetical protein
MIVPTVPPTDDVPTDFPTSDELVPQPVLNCDPFEVVETYFRSSVKSEWTNFIVHDGQFFCYDNVRLEQSENGTWPSIHQAQLGDGQTFSLGELNTSQPTTFTTNYFWFKPGETWCAVLEEVKTNTTHYTLLSVYSHGFPSCEPYPESFSYEDVSITVLATPRVEVSDGVNNGINLAVEPMSIDLDRQAYFIVYRMDLVYTTHLQSSDGHGQKLLTMLKSFI